IDGPVEAGIAPFRAAVEQISTVPGIRDVGAQVIISEIGTDMSRFPSDGHLISWAGLCPRSDESAGKRRSNRLREGAPLAQDHARAMRLVGRAQEGQLPACPIPATQGTAGSQEGNHGRCRLDPQRYLSHAQGWNPVSGPWIQSPPEPIKKSTNPAPDQTLDRPRLRCGAQTPAQLTECLRRVLFLSSDEAGYCPWSEGGRSSPLDRVNRQRKEPDNQWKAAAFMRWHEPDESRGSRPDL